MSRPAEDRQSVRQAQAEAVREAMGPDAAAFADECRALMACKLVALTTPTFAIGQPDTAPGLCVADMVIESLPGRQVKR